MTARIPYKNPHQYPWILQVLFWLQKKRFGQILNPTLLWGYSTWQSLAFILFYQAIERKNSPIPPSLRSLVMVRVAQLHGCNYCVDLNSLLFMERLKSKEKLLTVSQWRESTLFSQNEKWVLEYAEAMTHTTSTVTDEQVNQLKTFLSSAQIVELTGIIAYQNMSARFNSALNVATQGFCEKPKV